MKHADKPHLLLICTAHGVGGTESFVLTLSHGLRALGVDLQTVFPQTDGETGFLILARQIGESVQTSVAVRGVDMRRDYAHLKAMRTFVQSSRATVVNIHFGINFISIWDVLAIRLAGVKRCVATVHHAVPLIKKRTRLMTAIASRLCDTVAVTTPAMTKLLTGAGVARRKIVEVPPGIKPPTRTPARAEARAMLGLPQDALIVSSLGRSVPEKGFGDLIAGMALLDSCPQPVHLVVGGDGPARQIFEAQAAASLSNRAYFLGRIPDPGLLYAASDVFALPSHEEGFGMVFIEAAFHGIPSVGTDVGGVRYAITDNETGILVPLHSPGDLAAALHRLLTDAPLRARMGLAAQQRAQQSFSDRTMVERYREILVAPRTRAG